MSSFHYRIKTENGSIVSGSIRAIDEFDAMHKIQARYGDCEFLQLHAA